MVKKIILFLFLMVGLVCIFSPIYSDNNMFQSLIESIYNQSAFINIKNEGFDHSNHIKILSASQPVKLEFCKYDNKICDIEIQNLTDKWETYTLRLQAIGDGDIFIKFAGHLKENIFDIQYSLIEDYKSIKINDKEIKNSVNVSYYKGYSQKINVKNGEILTLEVKVRRHHFQYKDLTRFYNFNVTAFCITLFLSIVLVSVIMFYIIRYKFSGNKADKLFVVIFFILLIFPICHINESVKSLRENRTLANMEPLVKNGAYNSQFTEKFAVWLGDRFNGRTLLLTLHKNILLKSNKYFVLKNIGGVYNDGWLFEGFDNLNSNMSQDRLQKATYGIMAYQKFCKNNNIKCYAMVVPKKEYFATDKSFRLFPDPIKEDVQTLAEYVSENARFDITDPFEAMTEANKKDFVYFKTDHHWSDWGAFIGYQVLMKRIQKDFADLRILSEKDFDTFYYNKVRAKLEHVFGYGVTCDRLALDENGCPLADDYKYFTSKNENNIFISQDNFANKNFHFTMAPNKYKMMLIGNSFAENISYFLAASFETVLKRRTNNQFGDNVKLSRWKEEIVKEKPQILVIIINDKNLDNLADLKD